MAAETTELTKSEAKQLEAFGEAVDACKLSAVDTCVKAGEALKGAQELLAKPGCKGRFSEWVEERCRFSRQTAYHYINIFEQFSNCKVTLRFQTEAIHALADCEVAAKRAKELAGRGKFITQEMAKEFVAEAKAAKRESSEAADDTPPLARPHDVEPEDEPEEDSDVEDGSEFEDDEPEPSRPFAALPSLPPDVADAFEAMKLCILRRRIGGWQDIAKEDLVLTLDSLTNLAMSPPDVS